MSNTFTRAALGFMVLTGALGLMSSTSLWAVERFAGGAPWASIIVVVVTLIAEISIYMTTLHDPIYSWIKEPAREKAEKERVAREAEREKRFEKLGHNK